MSKADNRRDAIKAWKQDVEYPRVEKVGVAPNIDHSCIKCGSTIKCIEVGMWSGGLVHKVTAGYGSKHDGSIFRIAICDNCIDNTDSVVLIGDYLSPYLNEDIENGRITKKD